MSTDLFDSFALMTRDEFYEAADRVFAKGADGQLTIAQVMAYARKFYEDANFTDGLLHSQRVALEAMATDFMLYAKNNAAPDMAAQIEKAWAGTVDFGNRFGYRSGAIYDTLAPHRVFAD